MPRDARRTARLGAAVLAVAAFGLTTAPPAGADVRAASIDAVFLAERCAADVCDPDRDPALRDGAVVAGVVQVHVSAAADLGLEWVRLEAQYDGDPRWYCIEFWNAGRAPSFEAYRDWDTTHWTDPRPDECVQGRCSSCVENSPHHHGAPTTNRVHALRVVAREQASGVSENEDGFSAIFRLGLQNEPPAPRWATEPQLQTARSVTLRWNAVPGVADVREYRVTRTAPDGSRHRFAVSASSPQEQRCVVVAGKEFRCTDTLDDDAPTGTYRYTLRAARTALEGGHCMLAAGRCIVGPASERASVEVTGRAPTATPTASASASPSTPGATSTAGTTATPTASTGPPPAAAPPLAPAGAGGPLGRPVGVGIAAALLTLVLAVLAPRLGDAVRRG